MKSGIVFFEEIIENIKDATGIENMRPHYNRLRRFVFNVEQDIGTGGVVVLKKKQYTNGDGMYDRQTIILPPDFLYEWSYGALEDGILQGNQYRLFATGPEALDFYYLGMLLDQDGNPFTTRNHLEAVVAYTTYRFYSSRVFLKEGSANQLLMYKRMYEDEKLKARGHDAFPTEQEWMEIGKTRLGGTIEAMTNNGLNKLCFNTELDPFIKDQATAVPDPGCIEELAGVVNATASVVAQELGYGITAPMEGVSTVEFMETKGWMRPGVSPEHALEGSIKILNVKVEGLMIKEPTILCSESYQGSGTFIVKVEFGTGVGMAGILATPLTLADRFRIEYNGIIVTDSKFIGLEQNRQALLDLGYTENELALSSEAYEIPVLFHKNLTAPTYARIFIDGPLPETDWNIKGVCLTNAAVGSASVSGILEGRT